MPKLRLPEKINFWEQMKKNKEAKRKLLKLSEFNHAVKKLRKGPSLNAADVLQREQEAGFFLKDWFLKPITPLPVKKVKKKGIAFLEPFFWGAPVKNYTSCFDCGHAYIDKLHKKGFKTLGGGCFSSVLCKGDSKRVIKVGRNPDNWIDYILWSSKNGYMGGLAPKVFSYKYHHGKGDNGSPFYVAVMEKLDSTLYGLNRSHGMSFASRLFHHAVADNDNAKKCLDLVSPGAGEFAAKLKKQFSGRRLDLHDENFMIRGEQLVLIDPLTDGTETVKTRIKDFTKVAA